MKLVIDKTKYNFENEFYIWLLDYIKYMLKLKIDYRKLHKFQTLINKNKTILGPFKKYVSGKDVFITCVENIIVQETTNKLIYQIDPTAIYPGTFIKISMLGRMINYGTLNSQAYPIFTDIFTQVKNNIKPIYNIYKRQQK